MTNRDRVLRLLQGEACDQVPWFGDLDYWYGAMRYQGALPKQYEGDGYYRLNRDLGVGFYLQGYEPYKPVHDGVTVRQHEHEGLSTTRVETPRGTLEQVQEFLPVSCSWACRKHFVESVQDLPAFCYWLERTTYEPNYGLARERRHWIGSNGVVLCYLPRSAFMQMVAIYSGLMNLVYMLMEDPSQTRAALELVEMKASEAAALAVEAPVDCLMIPENLSSEVVGRSYYHEFMRSYEERWIAEIHRAGRTSFIHMDGTLKGLLREVAAAGFTVIEAMTPAPVGDLPIEEFRSYTGPQTVLWGGLPGGYFTPSVSDEEFDAFVIDTLRFMRQDGRSVLGVADQVPPDGLWHRVARVSELVAEHGRY